MRERVPLKGSEFYLPPETFRMVKHFCYSYAEMKREALNMQGLRSPAMDGMPRGSGVSNPTERDGMRLAELGRKIRIIEDAVLATAPDEYKWLFANVTDRRKPWSVLHDRYGCKIGRNRMGRMRREVYWRVSREI